MGSPPPHHRTHKLFLLCNYILLGAASACIFLTLSLRLLPAPCGLLLILLHALTIAGVISSCAAPASGSARWHIAHMVATVLTAIFQGAVALLIFTRTDDFLAKLRSYVRTDDGAVILRMVGGLGVTIFCLEWVALAVAFVLRYKAYVVGGDGGMGGGGGGGGARVQQEENLKDWPWPFQV